MKLQYILIAIVFLACSCENGLVTGIVVLNDNETIAVKPKLPVQPRILIAQKPVDVNATDATSIQATDAESEVEKNLNLCAHAMCPMIYCENNLPAIPSQGICCPRCVTNPKCNASACPKYKCVSHLIPANFTAGECCDRCAPVTTMPVGSRMTSSKPTKTRRPPSSSSSSEDHGRNIQHVHRKEYKTQLRLIRLLIETLSHVRRRHSHKRHDNSSESQE